MKRLHHWSSLCSEDKSRSLICVDAFQAQIRLDQTAGLSHSKGSQSRKSLKIIGRSLLRQRSPKAIWRWVSGNLLAINGWANFGSKISRSRHKAITPRSTCNLRTAESTKDYSTKPRGSFFAVYPQSIIWKKRNRNTHQFSVFEPDGLTRLKKCVWASLSGESPQQNDFE